MATKSVVTGDRYYRIDGKLLEIKRQLRQEGGYPYDLDRLERTLQDAVEGRFGGAGTFPTPDYSVTVAVKHFAYCSASAWCPKGWTIAPKKEQIASRFRGELELTPKSLALHLDPVQEGDGVIGGVALRTALAGKPVLPANVLDYLLEHKELIPESWKGKVVFFWGTIYRVSIGYLCVRYLYWRGGRWDWYAYWLGLGWDSRNPAAVPASI